MLHTFVGDDIDHVRDTVRQPMKDYLGSALNLVKDAAHAWTAFKRKDDGTVQSSDDVDLKSLSEEEMDDLLEFSFERYFKTSGLFGTPETCVAMVDELTMAGIDDSCTSNRDWLGRGVGFDRCIGRHRRALCCRSRIGR